MSVRVLWKGIHRLGATCLNRLQDNVLYNNLSSQWMACRGLKGSAKGNRRDTNTGPKYTQGKQVVLSQIVVRQTGYRFLPGYGIGVGRDFTLYALHPGRLIFEKIKDKKARKRTVVHVISEEDYKAMQENRLQRIIEESRTLGGINAIE
eukprot:jgi/Galph1/3349/GphlegSOOS_G2009.1